MGIIEEIYCENFMCHTKLRVTLNPHINFVTGENGSGKSAIIAAIQICLGGNARSTHRGKSIKNLIRHGHEGHAIVRVTLRNNGATSDAFRPNDFGSKVIVERLLRRDGSAEYRLKSESGSIVTKAKFDLEAMLDHFNIHTENPCTILDQENAKMFMKGNEQDKYKFFLQSTDLFKMRQVYANIDEQTRQISESIVPREEEKVEKAEREMNDALQRWKDAQSIEILENKLMELKKKLAWSFVAEQEAIMSQTQTRMERAEEFCKSMQVEYHEKSKQVSDVESAQINLNNELKALDDQLKELQVRKEETKSLVREKRRPLHTAKAEVKTIEQESDQLQKRMQYLRKQIQLKEEQNENYERRELERQQELAHAIEEKRQVLDQAERKLEAAKTSIDITENSAEELQSIESQYDSSQANLSEVNRELMRLSKNLENLKEQSTDSIAAFGNRVPALQRLIQANLHRFRDAPLGPLGMYVQLPEKHMQYGLSIEIALKGTLQSYLVTNGVDKAILDELKRTARCPANQATIIIAKPTASRYKDLRLPSEELAQHAICNLLKIENDRIFNALIDVCSIENKICFPDRHTAENKVLHGSSGSFRMARNVSEVYLASGDKFVVRNGNLAYIAHRGSKQSRIICRDINAQRDDLLHRKELLQAQKHRLIEDGKRLEHHRSHLYRTRDERERELQMLTRGFHQHRLAYQNLIDKRKAEEQQNEQKFDSTVLKEEMEQAQSEITALQQHKSKVLASMSQYNPCLEQHLKRLEEFELEERRFGHESSRLQKKIQNSHNQFRESKNEVAKLQQALQESSSHVENLQQDLDKCNESCEDLRRKAQMLCNSEERIQVSESHEFYGKKLTDLQKKLDQERRQFHGLDLADLQLEKEEKSHAFQQMKMMLDRFLRNLQQIKSMLQERQDIWKLLRKEIAHRTSLEFNNLMLHNNFAGKLKFHHQLERLEITVIHNDSAATTRASRVTDMKELSGGERSYTQVSLLLALGQCIECPFRVMDEFDVFMDAVNRDMTIRLLINAAKKASKKQFIFVTPNDLSALNQDSMVKIQQMQPPRDRDTAE